MPSVALKQSKDAVAVEKKHRHFQQQYTAALADVQSLQQVATVELIPSLAQHLDLQDEGKARVKALIDDVGTVFRFFRRSCFNQQQALSLLNTSLLWRMRTDLDLLSLSSLHPLYVSPPLPNPPLFWIHPKFHDLQGRPCGVIHLRSVERTAENSLDELKEYIVACMEILRRYISDLHAQSHTDSQPTNPTLQAVITIDLAGSGIANLELELLPFLLDLLKNHFPGMVGAVYILHYGWVHAGMWALAKRVLPEQALAKIFFHSNDDLKQHFEPSRIPKLYGGELDVEISASTNDVLKTYGKPRRVLNVAPSPSTSPELDRNHIGLSRTNSYDSIYEVFYSASGTPWASRPMTPHPSCPPTPQRDPNPSLSSTLGMTPSAARKLRDLQMTRGELSTYAEIGDELRASGRQRSNSDTRIENGKALGLEVNTVGLSPIVTPIAGRSPAVRGRRDPVDRHVRFTPASRNKSSSPIRRVGNSKNFTLYLPADSADDDLQLPSETESDASGKDGEKPAETSSIAASASHPSKQEKSSPAQAGFLARWTRFSHSSTNAKTAKLDDGKHVKDSPRGVEPSELVQASITFIEPGSPQLQVPNIIEPPLQWNTVRQHRFLSQRSRKYESRPGHMSPYNVNNPFFGYPAYIGPDPSSETKESQGRFRLVYSSTPQHLHARRRKRDLMRTLTYLFVLRVLAFHRKLRWRVALLWREVARTVRVGGEVQTDGDEFWRLAEDRCSGNRADDKNVRTLQQSTDPKTSSSSSRSNSNSKMASGFKLIYAVVIVLFLKPSWRRSLLQQIYLVMTSSLGSVKGMLPVYNLKNSKVSRQQLQTTQEPLQVRTVGAIQADDRVATTKGHSRTGLYIRERLGINAKPLTASGGKPSRSRSNALMAAGGVLALASLGYLLYSQFGDGKRGGGDDDDDDDIHRRGRRQGGPGESASKADDRFQNRPTMSLCVSPGFNRSPEMMEGLRSLLTVLSPLFLIHLVCPAPNIGVPENGEDDSADEVTSDNGSDLERSLSLLSSQLADIDGFDRRRILEYSRTSGRFSISRALTCDCHVEISIKSSSSSFVEPDVILSELEKIRRSCALVIYAAIGSDDSIQQVFQGLRHKAIIAGKQNQNAPPGMRAFDHRQHEQNGWNLLAHDIKSLRSSWK